MGIKGGIRLLVVPGTTEVGLEVMRSLEGIREVVVYGAGLDPQYGRDVGFEGYAFLSPSGSPGFLNELATLCRNWDIHYVYPAHDQVIFDLRDHFRLGQTRVIAHPRDAVFVCRSKHRTYEFLRDLEIVPRTFSTLNDIDEFPVFVKPSEGQGSVGASLVETREELIHRISTSHFDMEEFFTAFVVSERLFPVEVTVDCFSTLRKGLQYCAARTRASVRAGVSVHTQMIESQELTSVAERVSERLKLDGAWFFQAMQNATGQFRITEVATRLAGSSGLRRAQGVNLAHLSLLNAMDEPVAVLEQVGAARSRRLLTDFFLDPPHFQRVYVDYDDTLLRKGEINAELLGFLVAARVKGIGVHLLSRHRGDLLRQLEAHRLGGFFESVIHVLDGSPKSQFIDASGGALFIDDSFAERREVAKIGGSLALDTSAVPGLWGFLNDR